MLDDDAGAGRPGAGRRSELSEADADRLRAAWMGIARKILGAGAKTIGLLPIAGEAGLALFAVELGLALGQVSGHGSWGESAVVVLDEVAAEAVRGLHPQLPVLSPADGGWPTAWTPRLAGLLDGARDGFLHLIVDLTGFEARGEHLGAMALLDGVVVVARSGITGEAALGEAARSIPPGRSLGVLLVGGPG